MKVLLISNQHQNAKGVGNPIMYRMKSALAQDPRIDKVEFIPAYSSLRSLNYIRQNSKDYDIIHIHFGGIYAFFIWFWIVGIKAKRIITFHGTDIHAKAIKTAMSSMEKLKIRLNQIASFLSIRMFDMCGFVAKEMMNYVPIYLEAQMKKKAFLQPLGVDYSTFVPLEATLAQDHLGLDHKKYILFSDISNTNIKRRDIAESIAKELGPDYSLLIMSGVKPDEVPYYINACEFALLTSDEEGSPNIIREVLSLNKPFFSVDVGDAAKQLDGLKNSSIISRKPNEAAKRILEVNAEPYTDNTRESRKCVLDFVAINKMIVDIYLK
ncbi:MAG: hypothetical protein LIR40_14735 [Bacteroidota bacterium]|nr:hypothetical protein [Bacteroidota bacterium]